MSSYQTPPPQQMQIVPHYGQPTNQYSPYGYPQQQQQQQPHAHQQYQHQYQHPAASPSSQYGHGAAYGYQQQHHQQQPNPPQPNPVDMAFASPAPRCSILQTHDPYASSGVVTPPPPATPAPPSETELALMAFEQLDGAVTPAREASASSPSVVSPASSQGDMTPYEPPQGGGGVGGALTPYQSPQDKAKQEQDDAALARIIASQQNAMDRAMGRGGGGGGGGAMVVSGGYGGYDNYSHHRHHRNTRAMTSYDPSHRGLQTGVHPHKKEMKKERKVKTAGGVVGGAVVGGLALGPVGVVLGGAAGGYATRKIAKAGEKRAQRKFEKQTVREAAAHSQGASATFT